MKQHIMIAVVFVVGCATGSVAGRLVVPSVRAGTSPTHWEYECATIPENEDDTAALNKLGAEGWELVSFAPASSSGTVRLKVSEYTFCAKRALP
jgi:hypothetical protein